MPFILVFTVGMPSSCATRYFSIKSQELSLPTNLAEILKNQLSADVSTHNDHRADFWEILPGEFVHTGFGDLERRWWNFSDVSSVVIVCSKISRELILRICTCYRPRGENPARDVSGCSRALDLEILQRKIANTAHDEKVRVLPRDSISSWCVL